MNETNFKTIFLSIIFRYYSKVIYQKKERKKFYFIQKGISDLIYTY